MNKFYSVTHYVFIGLGSVLIQMACDLYAMDKLCNRMFSDTFVANYFLWRSVKHRAGEFMEFDAIGIKNRKEMGQMKKLKSCCGEYHFPMSSSIHVNAIIVT